MGPKYNPLAFAQQEQPAAPVRTAPPGYGGPIAQQQLVAQGPPAAGLAQEQHLQQPVQPPALPPHLLHLQQRPHAAANGGPPPPQLPPQLPPHLLRQGPPAAGAPAPAAPPAMPPGVAGLLFAARGANVSATPAAAAAAALAPPGMAQASAAAPQSQPLPASQTPESRAPRPRAPPPGFVAPAAPVVAAAPMPLPVAAAVPAATASAAPAAAAASAPPPAAWAHAPPGSASAAAPAAAAAPAPARFAPPQPPPTLEELQERLRREAVGSLTGGARQRVHGTTCFRLPAALRWLEAYAPEASQAIDGDLSSYFQYTQDKHGQAVLACVIFFTYGHHERFKGASLGLRLETARSATAVLNQRTSFYRIQFARSPAACEALTALVVHRPDVASQLSDESLTRLFERTTEEEDALAALAALAMLPEGWETVCLGDPHSYAANFVAAVLQDKANASSMAALLRRKLAAAAASAPAPAPAGGEPTPAPAAQAQAPAGGEDTGRRRLSALQAGPGDTGGQAAAATFADQLKRRVAGAAPAGLGGTSPQRVGSGGWGAAPPAAAAAAPGAARFPSAPSAAHQRHHEPQPPLQKQQQQQDGDGGGGGDVVHMALAQLTHERPDVACFATRNVRDGIKAMPQEAALAAVGALMCLPQGWAEGLKDPKKALAATAARAAAHASGAGGAGEDEEEGWADVGHGRGAKAAGQAPPAQASWSRLQRERPDIWQHMRDRHRALIQQLQPEQQLQVLEILAECNPACFETANDPEAMLTKVIANTARFVTEPFSHEIKALLAELAEVHPDIIPYVDSSLVSRIAALPVDQGVAVMQALIQLDFSRLDNWHTHCVNPTAWLMGVVNRAIRTMAAGGW